jgi:hypothetical protein
VLQRKFQIALPAVHGLLKEIACGMKRLLCCSLKKKQGCCPAKKGSDLPSIISSTPAIFLFFLLNWY